MTQQNSTDQYLDNLRLSFGFYRNVFVNNIKVLKEKIEDQEVLDSVNMIERFSNYLVIDYCLSFHRSLSRTYHVAIEIDWLEYFDYFDLLDALIFPKYQSSQWDKHENIIRKKAKYEDVVNFSLAYYASRKLRKLIPQILFELYRDQYPINHCQRLDLKSLKETDFMTEELIYRYFLEEQDSDTVKVHLEYYEGVLKLKTSATKYLESIELSIAKLSSIYGDDINEDLNLLLDRSYYNRLNLINMIRKSCHSINPQEFYSDLSYECFFSFPEFFTFHSTYPSVLRVNSEPLNSRDIIERDALNIIKKFGPDIEEHYRNLYCYLIMLENLLLEYMQFHMYVRSGTKPKLGDLSLGTALHTTQATFDDIK